MLSRFPRWAALAAATALTVTSVLPQGAAAQSYADQPCTFKLGFSNLVEVLSSDLVGSCVRNEYFNTHNGNAEQLTSNGLLYWRKSDNTTAFTDGMTTWLASPYGIQVRLNTEPAYDWEVVGLLTPAADTSFAPVISTSSAAIVQAPAAVLQGPAVLQSPQANGGTPARVLPAELGSGPSSVSDSTMTSTPVRTTAPRDPEITPSFFDVGPANLRNADLTKADRRELSLVNADLYHAKLVSADFSYANLSGASLIGAEVTRAVFFGTDLTQARGMGMLSNSSLNTPGPNFGKAKLKNAKFSFAKLPFSDFRQADMSYSDFSHASLYGSDLRSASLKCADFSYANLDKVDLTGTDLTGAKLPANIATNTTWKNAIGIYSSGSNC